MLIKLKQRKFASKYALERQRAIYRPLKKVIVIHGVLEDDTIEFLKKRRNDDSEIVILEGRPSLRTAKILYQKFKRYGISPTLIADNMAGFLFSKKMVKEVWLSYQTQEKKGVWADIGALILAVLGFRHGVVVRSFPSAVKTRRNGNPEDIFYFQGKRIAPRGIKGFVPLLEWVPRKYITQIYE